MMPHPTIYILIDGRMVKQREPSKPRSRNFVICCTFGDWSGFRTLEECENQFPELEKANRGNFYYWVEER